MELLKRGWGCSVDVIYTAECNILFLFRAAEILHAGKYVATPLISKGELTSGFCCVPLLEVSLTLSLRVSYSSIEYDCNETLTRCLSDQNVTITYVIIC